jgi:plastocyanin
MRASAALSGALFVVFVCSACGGGNNNSYNNPTAPTNNPPTPPPATANQIAIMGDRGAQSFNPNPATVAQGQSMTFKNTDGTTHHIVANDGSFDTGSIAAGATSAAVTLTTNGTNYHCTIHPGMVGSINASTGEPPPCTGVYCN